MVRKEIREGTFDGELELRRDDGDVHEHTYEILGQEGRTVYFVFEGPALVREN